MRVSIPTNGAAIRQHRQRAGWNCAPFARSLGINANYLSKLERGTRHASPAMLRRIADALHVTVADLILEATPDR
jgi:transcriptional regulator with XRE-family HTH domain